MTSVTRNAFHNTMSSADWSMGEGADETHSLRIIHPRRFIGTLILKRGLPMTTAIYTLDQFTIPASPTNSPAPEYTR